MVLMAENSALVAGGGNMAREVKMQRVRVLRGFYLKGDLTPKDKELDVPVHLAIELRGAKKVEFIETPQAAPQENETTATEVTATDEDTNEQQAPRGRRGGVRNA